MDGFDAAGACGDAFKIRSAGNGRTAQGQSVRRAGVDADRGRTSITCGRLGAAVPLPKRVSPPVTELGLSGPTKLLISRENERAWRVIPRGGPSEGRAGNQRDQCESSDKRLHHISPCLWTTLRDLPGNREDRRLVPSIPEANRLSVTLGQLYLWIYCISQRSKALYFGLLARVIACKTAVARTPLGSEIFR